LDAKETRLNSVRSTPNRTFRWKENNAHDVEIIDYH